MNFLEASRAPFKTSKNSLQVFDTHPGFSILINGLPNPLKQPDTAKLIAILWSSNVSTSTGICEDSSLTKISLPKGFIDRLSFSAETQSQNFAICERTASTLSHSCLRVCDNPDILIGFPKNIEIAAKVRKVSEISLKSRLADFPIKLDTPRTRISPPTMSVFTSPSFSKTSIKRRSP